MLRADSANNCAVAILDANLSGRSFGYYMRAREYPPGCNEEPGAAGTSGQTQPDGTFGEEFGHGQWPLRLEVPIQIQSVSHRGCSAIAELSSALSQSFPRQEDPSVVQT